jgi:branched-chain amino acid transport system substrate-binding protein
MSSRKKLDIRKKIDRREFLKYSAGIGSAVAIAGFPALIKSAPKEVVIVGLWPMTGTGASWGERNKRGGEWVCEEYNKKGGIKSLGGAPIKYVVVDMESKVDVAANRAEKIVAGDAVAITGIGQSAATLVVSQITERAEIPFVVAVDWDPLITRRGHKYTFRIVTMITDLVREIMNYTESMSKKSAFKVKKVGVLCEDSIVGVTASEAFKKSSEEKGWEVVDVIKYSAATTKDFTGMISKFKDAGTDILVGHNRPSDASLIVRTCIEMDYNPIMIAGATGGWTSIQFAQALKEQADFITVGQEFSPMINIPDLQTFRKSYFAKFNQDLDISVAGGASATYLVIKALEKAGSTDRKVIRDVIANIELRMGEYYFMFEGCKFNEKGDNIRASGFVTQYKDGILNIIYPESFANMKPVWPKPKWKR